MNLKNITEAMSKLFAMLEPVPALAGLNCVGYDPDTQELVFANLVSRNRVTVVDIGHDGDGFVYTYYEAAHLSGEQYVWNSYSGTHGDPAKDFNLKTWHGPLGGSIPPDAFG